MRTTGQPDVYTSAMGKKTGHGGAREGAGRPPIPEAEKKSATLPPARVSAAERDCLAAAAADAEVGLTTYIREAAIAKARRAGFRVEDYEE